MKVLCLVLLCFTWFLMTCSTLTGSPRHQSVRDALLQNPRRPKEAAWWKNFKNEDPAAAFALIEGTFSNCLSTTDTLVDDINALDNQVATLRTTNVITGFIALILLFPPLRNCLQRYRPRRR